ncbi:MAG: rhodanese-like domain-containing protein [Desulfamplus sp.]|nr:rhodanese-like domain-containing protein [Desulfamplus sp.]
MPHGATIHFRSDKLPLIGDFSVDARFTDSSGETLVISLEDARALFEQKSAVFIDARPKEQYIAGHIKDSLCLFNNVKVLVNGWSLWHEAGLPVDTGD